MHITVLTENNSISPAYRNVHGLCLYIEAAGHKILFDLGPDDTFLHNARQMDIDMSAVDTVVISHGHYDHGGGLSAFLAHNHTAKIYIHEKAFLPYYAKVGPIKHYVGLDQTLAGHDRFVLTGDSMQLDAALFVFAGVTGRKCFSTANKVLCEKTNDGYVEDRFTHEQSLLITENGKNVLLAGCAHNGILNILERLKSLRGILPGVAIAGFHLHNPLSNKSEKPALVEALGAQLAQWPTQFYTCHCTGEKPFAMLQHVLGDQIAYLATGAQLELL